MLVDRSLRDEVARQICERYTARLRALVRAKLFSDVRSKEGGTLSVVQKVFKSYFEWISAEVGYENVDVKHEWSRLAKFAARKCGRACRSYKRKGGKERSLDSPLLPFADSIKAAPDPSPEEVAIVADYLAKLDEDERQICDLLMEGYSQEEIAGRMGCCAMTVHRRLTGIRGRLEEMQGA
jgi:RNA polymerase sigma factor (sigma-70 family)